MLTTVLALSLYQSGRVQARVDTLVSTYARAMVVQSQLERDLMGVFVPRFGQEPAQKQETQQEPKNKEQKLEKLFFGSKQEQNFDLLTFMTHNAMQAYWGAKLAKPRPRMARVVYRLVPDKDQKNSFNLMRQEGTATAFSAYEEKAKEPIKAYQLVEGIKECTVRYRFKKEYEGEEKEKQKNKPPEYKLLREWLEQEKKEDEKSKTRPPVPSEVEIHLVLWDSSYQKDTAFDFTILIPVDYKQEKKMVNAQGQRAKQEPKKSIAHNTVRPKMPPQKTVQAKQDQQEHTAGWFVLK